MSAAQKLPAKIECPIPAPASFTAPPGVKLLRRTNLVLYDASQNNRIADIQACSDILAVRPTDEKTFVQACNALDCDIISLDLSQRFHFPFKHKTLNSATDRGVKIELCYGPGLAGEAASRRNLIQNSTSIIRATRGRGIIISSEAQTALACRSPWDVINLASVWGLGRERGMEAVTKETRWLVAAAKLKRSSYRAAIDVVVGIDKPAKDTPLPTGKRQADWQPLSQRAKKRMARERAAAKGLDNFTKGGERSRRQLIKNE